jgi:hypothetical protein
MKHLWWGRIPLEDIDKHVLIRGVGLSALGKLDRGFIELAAKLDIPHHDGAGGEEDFVDKGVVPEARQESQHSSQKEAGTEKKALVEMHQWNL